MDEFKATQGSKELLKALKNENVKFAHWKGNSHLRKSLSGHSDIEILVDPEHRSAFESVMRKLHFIRAKSPAWLNYDEVEDWIGFDSETGNLLHLDTHYAIVTGLKFAKQLYLPWRNELFDELITDEDTGWPIPRPEFEAIILLIRIQAKMSVNKRRKKKPEIPERRLIELSNLLRSSDEDTLLRICDKLGLRRPDNFIVGVRQIKSENDTDEVLRLSKCLYTQAKKYYRKSWIKCVFRSYYYRYYLVTATFFSRFFAPVSLKKKLDSGGNVIALIGIDGSGKSTLSRALVNWLSAKIDTHYFYLGKTPFIESYGKILLSPGDVLYQDNKLGRLFRKMSGDRYHISLARQKIRMLQLSKSMSRKGSVIMCDRYPQKDIIGMNDGPKLQGNRASKNAVEEMGLFEQMAKLEPDVVFRLQVTPEVAVRRKPDHNLEAIRRKCRNINKISFRKAEIIDIDAGRPQSELLLQVKSEIWKSLV